MNLIIKARLKLNIIITSKALTLSAGELNSTVHAMSQLDRITQQNASFTEELAATAEETSPQAEQLLKLINFFKLKNHTLQTNTPPAQHQAACNFAF